MTFLATLGMALEAIGLPLLAALVAASMMLWIMSEDLREPYLARLRRRFTR